MSNLIRIQDAIDAIVNTPSEVQNKNIPLVNPYDGAAFRQIEILKILEALPIVEPERTAKVYQKQAPDRLYYFYCGVCGEMIDCSSYEDYKSVKSYCGYCGAKLDWSE